jgi:glycosyltransferase involved in cell wall biosynthesis
MPYVVSLRGSDIPGYNPRLRMLDLLIFKRMSRIIWGEAQCITTLSKNSSRMAGRTMEMEFKVIYNGVNTEQFYPEKKQADGLKLLCVGRLETRKGIDYVLPALEEIVKKYPGKKIHLTIVGSGNVEQELKSMAERLRLCEHVTFLGAIKHKDIPAIYRAHDIFILASVNEALSNVILEAIASGLAIITTNTGAAEFIDHNGYVVNKKDHKDIADKLDIFINDPGIIARFKERSAEIARSMVWSDCSNSYLRIYENVIKGRQLEPCISCNNRFHL